MMQSPLIRTAAPPRATGPGAAPDLGVTPDPEGAPDLGVTPDPGAAPDPESPSDSTAESGDRHASPLHVGIIMDGNGRWAQRRGLPRLAGHRAGARTVRRIVSAAPRHGIGVLTLYAFSSDNWRRPALEVRHLMSLLRTHLRSETRRCAEEGVRITVIGRRDRLDPALVREIEASEKATRDGGTLHLQLAVDYSAREAILRAAQAMAAHALTHALTRTRTRTRTRESDADAQTDAGDADTGDADNQADAGDATSDAFRTHLSRALHLDAPVPDVDLVIRTGGEQRLSDFLLWESAYAELVFTPRAWPDFDEDDLGSALADFARRDRRFGGLAPAAGSPWPSTDEA
ncbi:polyprenyl diphosphate synthase [Gaopeijia maritima]|uniref:polyprenyl diphosphate synthase n=1 Tax=Gaopeijia maritima TaxID=3119007 RepID=UPI00327E62F5